MVEFIKVLLLLVLPIIAGAQEFITPASRELYRGLNDLAMIPYALKALPWLEQWPDITNAALDAPSDLELGIPGFMVPYLPKDFETDLQLAVYSRKPRDLKPIVETLRRAHEASIKIASQIIGMSVQSLMDFLDEGGGSVPSAKLTEDIHYLSRMARFYGLEKLVAPLRRRLFINKMDEVIEHAEEISRALDGEY